MPTPTIKVQAKPGLLLLDLNRLGRQRHFIGWRECLRAPDGSYKEEAEHTIPAAAGVKTDEKGQWESQTSDLFVEGFEVRLTRMDPTTKKPMVVTVPDEPYFRKAIQSGDLTQVDDKVTE